MSSSTSGSCGAASRSRPATSGVKSGPNSGGEHGVDRVQQLGAPAEVVGELERRVARGERRPALAEQADVGVAEAVDRLELVSDGEQVVALERAQDPHLAGVGVLELVDHHELEALGPAAPQGAVAVEQRARLDLQVVEVERSAAPLGRRVRVVVAPQQLAEQRQRGDRVTVGARLRVRVERLAEGGARPAGERAAAAARQRERGERPGQRRGRGVRRGVRERLGARQSLERARGRRRELPACSRPRISSRAASAARASRRPAAASAPAARSG